MKFREYRQEQPAELELAPMVDVVFLLLIFFIMSWQFARFERSTDISVPAAEEADNRPRQAGEIIINVNKEGDVILNEVTVTQVELLQKLEAVSSAYPDQPVILRGDAETDFQHIINVLDQIKKAGIWNVAFATKRPDASPPAAAP